MSFPKCVTMTKNTHFFPILHVFAPLNNVRAYIAWSWKTTLIMWFFLRGWYPTSNTSAPPGHVWPKLSSNSRCCCNETPPVAEPNLYFLPRGAISVQFARIKPDCNHCNYYRIQWEKLILICGCCTNHYENWFSDSGQICSPVYPHFIREIHKVVYIKKLTCHAIHLRNLMQSCAISMRLWIEFGCILD